MWTYSLKFSLRSLARELVRNMWGRLLVYPSLAANEYSAARLARYIGRRARKLGVSADADGTRLAPAGQGAELLTKDALRRDPWRFVRPRRWGTLLRSTIHTSGTSGTPLTLVQTLGASIREEAFVYR